MKKILYLLLTLFGCTLLANGQDFKPGQQAQGILESKNVTVDHATGTFHYRVPLYTLKSGAFELPVTLDYTARGVRVDDQPGLVGYNWTLNTGGVVTRTVRGGMADELPDGYAHSENAITPLWDDVTNVNLHRRDGESDIFTAVFNGRSVNFLIRKKANGTLYAEPLELTAVKIEPVSDWSGISAWTVTDEMGNRYLFEEQEYVKDLNKVDAISTNGVYDMSYVSAWYLSRIEPVNTAPITFIYEKGDPYGDLSAYMRKSHYNVYTSVHYDYGREMVEYPCDFGKYQEKYLKYLSQAKDALQSSVRDIKKVQELESMYGLRWFTNSTAAKSFAEYQRATRSALGCISDLRLLHSSSLKEVGALTQLIDYYHDENYLVSIYLTNARQCILDCLAERRTYRSKETQNEVLKAEEIFPDEMAVLDLQQQQQDLKEMDRVLSEQPADFYGEAATFLSCLRRIDWDTIRIRSLLPYQVTYLRRDMPKLFRLLECLSEPQSPITKSEADTIINVAQGPLMFMNRLYRELVNHAAFEPVRQTYMAILFHLDRQLTPEVLYYSYWYHRNEVKVNARSNTRWSIYTLGEAPELTCTFVCGDGEHTVKIKPHNTGIPSCYLLDSGGLQDVRSLRIHVPSTVYYLAILPQRATFEAKTYNADGTVAVKFGPDGQSESYRYDAAGRVNSISNRDGKLIKTIIYTDPVNQ